MVRARVGTKLKCMRCGHVWYTRRPVLPKVCPKCKSKYWNFKMPKTPKTVQRP